MNTDQTPTPLQAERIAQIKDLLNALYAIMFDLIDQEDDLMMEVVLEARKREGHVPMESLVTLHEVRQSFRETSDEIEKLHVELETLTGSRSMG